MNEILFVLNDVLGFMKAYQCECWRNKKRDKEPVVSGALKSG